MPNQEALSNVDHQNSERVKMLSNVALLDQKTTRPEQDIRDNEIFNTIRRITTTPKLNPLKINELLSMILNKVQMQNLLHLRAVCSHWKLTIEAICAQKKCLKLYSSLNRTQIIALPNRFFGTIKLEQFVKLKMICFNGPAIYCDNPLENNFCTFLGQTFPSIDQLIVDLDLDEDSITNLFNMLQIFWPNLNTLSLNNVDADLTTTRIEKLKRLDVNRSLDMPPNLELISQLEHFSWGINNKKDSLDRMSQLGLNCTSFYWGITSLLEFDQWIQRNSAQVLANLTHLGLFLVKDCDESLIRLICENFPSLQVLSVSFMSKGITFDSASFVQFAKLSHLTTLCLGCTLFDLDSLESSEIRTRLLSIRVLNLLNFGINGTIDPLSVDFDCDRFFRILAFILPNIDKLGILYTSEAAHDKIHDNLNHFGKFLKFKTLNSVNDSLYY